jgi:phosphatidylinositol-3-phosphatase
MLLRRVTRPAAAIAVALLVACGGTSSQRAQLPAAPDAPAGFTSAGSGQPAGSFVPDRIIVIVMENHSFDDVIGATDRSGNRLLTPFLTQIAQTNRLSTLQFGVAHPSLPNYLSLISGDFFGVHDDSGSCYAPHRPKGCHSFAKKNLVDSLEAAGISWASYNESMPHDGYLAQQYPKKGDGLYRQKHNPFVYFKDIANDPARLANVKTFVDLKSTLNNGLLPRFSFIVPNECHDMHGSVGFCNFGPEELIKDGDAALQKLVQSIISSGSFTNRSLMFILWDEGDNNLGCCDAPPVQSGGHIPLILVTGAPGFVTSSQPYNHYSVLATIETVWNLPKLGYTKDSKNVVPMLDLLPRK